MTQILILKSLRIGNRSIVNSRKFLKFPTLPISHKSSTFCSQIKEKTDVDDDNDNDNDNDKYDELDVDALKNEMFEDFEIEKENLQTNINMDMDMNMNMNEDEITEENIDSYDVFQDKNERLSFVAEQFKKRMEFNDSLKTASKIKSVKGVNYSSSSLKAGIPEILYDAEGIDKWVNYLRLYTYTPFTMGLLFVPIAIYGFPEWEIFPKLMLGGFYMTTSAIFPYFSYRAVKDKVNRAWLSPDCEKIIIEKINFFFQPYKEEYFIRDLRVLHKKGSDRHCWFQCKKRKKEFLLVSELMQHTVWLQLLGVDADQIADATLRSIASDGKVTMFRGPNT